MIVIMYA
jgi:hypothetical protein